MRLMIVIVAPRIMPPSPSRRYTRRTISHGPEPIACAASTTPLSTSQSAL